MLFPFFVIAKEQKDVFILNSYHSGYVFSDGEVKGAEKVLKGKANIEVFHMNTKLFSLKEREEKIYTTLKKRQIQPDIIISLDDNALLFLKKYHHELFPDIPIVFTGVNQYSPKLIEGMNNITGVGEKPPHKQIVDLILKLHPDVEWVIHVTDNTHSSKLHMKQFIHFVNHYDKMGDILLGTMSNWTLLEFKKFIDEVKDYKNVVVYVSGFYRDRLGYKIRHTLATKVLSTLGEIPIYTHSPQFINAVVGGAIIDGDAYGKMAGEKALKILEGVNVEDIPIVNESLVKYQFNYEQLKRFSISKKQLPEKSVIVNKPERFYTKHTGMSLLILLVIIIDGILIYALIRKRNNKFKHAHA